MTYNHGLALIFISFIIVITTSCNGNTDQPKSDVSDTPSVSKHSANKRPEFDTSRSITKISPNLYKTVADTLNIRVIEGTYRPGDSSIMHGHPDFAMYVIKGSTVELTLSDGAKQNLDFKDGMSVIIPATTHSAKNIGKNTLKIIVVEVDRPRE